MHASEVQSRRRQIARGFSWNIAYRVFEVGLSFVAMFILVRIVSPHEYGLWGAAVGWLAFLNSFNCSMFIAQALQEPEGLEPDWSLHWSAGLYIQLVVIVTCHAIAGLCWLSSRYRSIAPLLHLATIGLVLDWPSQLRTVMLRRELDFRRLAILMGYSTTLQLAVTVGMALIGGGAYALVVGSNIVPTVPFVIDLLVVKGWRPRDGWWRWPDWTAYRSATRFGCQRAGSCLIRGVRGVAEAAILPGTLGYPSIGLLGRAQALISTTIGRAGSIIAETLYPLLPRYASEASRYSHYAALFAQAFLLVSVSGAFYMGLEGRGVSRLLYGDKWIAADPLIWPAAVGAVGLSLFVAGSSVLLAANRLRICLILDSAAAALAAPMVAVVLFGGGVVHYAWALALAQIVAASVALWAASSFLGPNWLRSVLLPPGLSSVLAVAAVLVVESFEVSLRSESWSLVVGTCVYGLTFGLALRAFFPSILATVLSLMPWGYRVGGWLRLRAMPVMIKDRV